MTADVLVYACGGGLGHAVRGQVLGAIAESCGFTVKVLVRPGILAAFRRLTFCCEDLEEFHGDVEMLEANREAHLLVDTFPLGLHNELAPLLKLFKTRSFIARYSEATVWSRVSALYQRIFLPYTANLSEWDSVPRSARFIGFLLRPERFCWTSKPRLLRVLDPERRLSSSFLEELGIRSQRHGFQVDLQTSFGRVLDAEKVLCVGAGYNTVYESLRDNIDMRFLPIHKRFDNQFKRVLRYKCAVGRWGDLDAWLTAAPPSRLMPALRDAERIKEVFLHV